MNYPYFRQHGWMNVVNGLQRTVYAEQMVCSISSQLYHIPQTKNIKGLQEVHDHLYKSSYHRITALGSANRLANGKDHPSIRQTVTACIQNAMKEDRNIRKSLQTLRDHAPDEHVKGFIQIIFLWQDQKEDSLQRVKELVEVI